MTQEYLIDMLKFPRDEKEIGWNNAIIHLLKAEADKPAENSILSPTIIEIGRESFRAKLNLTDLEVVYGHYSHGNKLNAVKAYKDFSGLGLKESKDDCDIFFEKLHAKALKSYP